MREQAVLSSRASESAAGLSSSGSMDTAQELSEKLWGLLVDGLQPFMQWELQSGMGDLWDQVAPMLCLSTSHVPASLQTDQWC